MSKPQQHMARSSSLVSLLALGVGLFSCTLLYKYQIQPYFNRMQHRKNEQWADVVYKLEVKEQEEARQSR